MEVNLDDPKEGEVLIEIKATGICHTDEFTLSGADPEGIFPSILGHEGRGRGGEMRPGRQIAEAGRPRHPALHPRMPRMPVLPVAQDQPLHRHPRDARPGPDARRHHPFSMLDGTPIYHYMGCSTFAKHTVMPEIALAKVREDAPFDKICYIGCGVTTGIGAVLNTARSRSGPRPWSLAWAASG
jgi:S-(hydroxymethyl)glutathione dehydrogenase / alcohol dehydrogenase